MEWGFNLLLSQPLTREQADQFDHCDALADGAISYTLGPDDPDAWPCRADPDELRTLSCDVEAPSLLDAVAQAVQRVRLIDGLRVVGVALPDSVTLDEAAQRSGCDVRRLTELCRDRLLPESETTDGTALFSWAGIAGALRGVGDRVPDVPQDVVVADRALWLADALDGADVPPGALASLGLPVG